MGKGAFVDTNQNATFISHQRLMTFSNKNIYGMIYTLMAFTVNRTMINSAILAALVYFTCANMTTVLSVAAASYLLTMF